MESIGKKLRTARLQKELTLEQIHDKTRISLKNLEAIEQDDMSRFGSPFFYKSFVRQIADQVGLEYRVLASDVDAAAGVLPEPLMPGQGDAPLIAKAAAVIPTPKRSKMRWLYSLGSLLTLFALCSGAYSLWVGSRPGSHTFAASETPAHIVLTHLSRAGE
jgi:cytoskeletal protein RodZ